MIAEKWQELAPRERALVLIAGLVLGGALLFEMAIDPTLKARSRLTQALPQLRAESAALTTREDDAKRTAQALSARRQTLSEAALKTSLAATGLNPTSVQLTDQRVELKFSKAQADTVLRWAAEAAVMFGVAINRLEVTWDGDVADIQVQLSS